MSSFRKINRYVAFLVTRFKHSNLVTLYLVTLPGHLVTLIQARFKQRVSLQRVGERNRRVSIRSFVFFKYDHAKSVISRFLRVPEKEKIAILLKNCNFAKKKIESFRQRYRGIISYIVLFSQGSC